MDNKNAIFAKIKTVWLSPRRKHGHGTFTIVWRTGSALMKFGGHVLVQSVPRKINSVSAEESAVVLNCQLWVPPGFAHGFLTLSKKAKVSYKVTNFMCFYLWYYYNYCLLPIFIKIKIYIFRLKKSSL